MDLFNIADTMEYAASRTKQALDLLQIITDDMEESDPASECGAIAFVGRRDLYINTLAILRRELETISADLSEHAGELHTEDTTEEWLSVRSELAELAAKGVDIPALLREMGHDRIGELTTDQLSALLSKARSMDTAQAG